MEGKKEIEVGIGYFKTKKGKLKVSNVSDNVNLVVFLGNRDAFKRSMNKKHFKALDKYFEKEYKNKSEEERYKLFDNSLKEIFEKFKEVFDKSMTSEGVEYHYKEKESEK